MKNLELFSEIKELSSNDLQKINGGFICGGFCIAGIAFLVGAAIGVAVSEVVHHHS